MGNKTNLLSDSMLEEAIEEREQFLQKLVDFTKEVVPNYGEVSEKNEVRTVYNLRFFGGYSFMYDVGKGRVNYNQILIDQPFNNPKLNVKQFHNGDVKVLEWRRGDWYDGLVETIENKDKYIAKITEETERKHRLAQEEELRNEKQQEADKKRDELVKKAQRLGFE